MTGDWDYIQTLPETLDVVSVALSDHCLLVSHTRHGIRTVSQYRLKSDSSNWELEGGLAGRFPPNYSYIGTGIQFTGNGCVLGSGLVGSFSGLPLPPGRCLVFNEDRFLSYESWAKSRFTHTQIAEGESQPEWIANRSGVPNLQCYAMGLDPFAPKPGKIPRITLDSGGQPVFEFQLAPQASDVRVLLRRSLDLKQRFFWNPGDQVEHRFHEGFTNFQIPVLPQYQREFLYLRFLDHSTTD